jgi:tetratricopeptide (TPR) repeat protein
MRTLTKKLLLFFVFLFFCPPNNFSNNEEQCFQSIIQIREQGFDKKLDDYTKKCLRNFPDSARLQRLRGLVLFELEHYATAAVFFQKAIKIDPQNQTDTFFLLLRSQLLSDDPLHKHRTTLKLFKKHFPENSRILAEAATLLIEAGKSHSAYEYLVSLIEEGFPDVWLYHFKLGQLYCNARAWDDAIQQLLISHRLKSDFPSTLVYLGRAWDGKDNHHFALSFYTHALLAGLDINSIPGLEKRMSELQQILQPKTESTDSLPSEIPDETF